MKIIKFIIIISSLLTLNFNTSFSQANPHREILIEDTLYHFSLNYNLVDKIIDSTNLSSSTQTEKDLFKQFFGRENQMFFGNTFDAMIKGVLYSKHLPALFDDQFNSYLLNETSLLNKFDNWKNTLNNSVIGHAHESGNCDNVDFELGNYSQWTPFKGTVPSSTSTLPQYTIQNRTLGTATGQHTIVNGGFDANVPVLPMLNPNGGSYSVKLGDDLFSSSGSVGDVSQIKKLITVSSSNPYFTYDYAVVFNNPGHNPAYRNPFFKVEFYDTNNVKLNICGNYEVVSNSALGFKTYNNTNWKYKEWSRLTLDLKAYIGDKVNVVFTVADCRLTGHAGRAYIDGRCFLPQININYSCKGITLEADSGYYKYQWYQGSPLDTTLGLLVGKTSNKLLASGPGHYHVKLTSENGCEIFVDTLIDSLYIVLNQTNNVKKPSCFGGNNGELTINAFGGAPPYNYSVDGGITTSSSKLFTGLLAGNYTCIVYDASGCSDTTIVTINQPAQILPNLAITNAKCFNFCNGEVLAIPSGGISPSGIYKVEYNNIVSTTKKKSNLCAGTYNVKVTDENGCYSSTPFTVTEPIAETIDNIIVTDESCYNNCSGSITVNDVKAVKYSIDNGLTYQTSNTFTNLCAQAGPYKVTIKTNDNCIANETKIIKQPLPLEISPLLRDTFICLNKFADYSVNAHGGTPPYTYKWSNGSTINNFSVSPKTNTYYTVEVKDKNNCIVTDEFKVNLFPQPTANFIMTPGPTTDVFNVKVNLKNTSFHSTPLIYEWSISNLADYNTKDVYYEFPAIGGHTYTNSLKVENKFGCRDSVYKDLHVKYDVILYIPNTFTPNGDNLNDIFIPEIEGLIEEEYKFMIYNKWGNLLFSTNNMNEGWDGYFKGEKVNDEIYTWKIEGKSKETGEDFKKNGLVMILNKL